MTDSFLFTAASVLFLAWTLIVGALSAATFARDLLPAKITASRDNIRRKQG